MFYSLNDFIACYRFYFSQAEESDTTFAKMYLPIVDEGNKRVWHPERSYAFFLNFFWRHKLNCARLDEYVSSLIRARWTLRRTESAGSRNERRHDILDHIMSTFEKDDIMKKWGEPMVRQLRDEMKTYMLAGHETSAAMMTWAFYELLQDDQLCEQVKV